MPRITKFFCISHLFQQWIACCYQIWDYGFSVQHKGRSMTSLWALCSPREHCSAGHTHLQLAPLNKLKQPAAFLRAALLSPQPVSNPFLCSLSPEMAALNSSGSTLQTTELKCPSNKRADNTGIYCLPWLLIFVLAFTL